MRNLLPQNRIEDIVYAAVVLSLIAAIFGLVYVTFFALGAWIAAGYYIFAEDMRP